MSVRVGFAWYRDSVDIIVRDPDADEFEVTLVPKDADVYAEHLHKLGEAMPSCLFSEINRPGLRDELVAMTLQRNIFRDAVKDLKAREAGWVEFGEQVQRAEAAEARVAELEAALDRVGAILGADGCDCECGHHSEEHDDEGE